MIELHVTCRHALRPLRLREIIYRQGWIHRSSDKEQTRHRALGQSSCHLAVVVGLASVHRSTKIAMYRAAGGEMYRAMYRAAGGEMYRAMYRAAGGEMYRAAGGEMYRAMYRAAGGEMFL